MADGITVLASPSEVSALKQALFAQQELLQELHDELEAEREASATAASEALAVILRLQEEKAAVKMEAEQFKRLAEEKMCHAEESFAVIEDVINDRDMEVADLEYQLEYYRYKLLSIGCIDPGDGDLPYPEHLLHRSENSRRDLKPKKLGRRNSEPVLLPFKKIEDDVDVNSLVQKKHTVQQDTKDSVSDSDVKTGNDDSIGNSSEEGVSPIGNQLKELNERVKGILGDDYYNLQHEKDSNDVSVREEFKQPNDGLENCVNGDHSSSPGVLDVFEVPQVDRDHGSSELSSLSKSPEKNADKERGFNESKNDDLKPYTENENIIPNTLTCKTSNVESAASTAESATGSNHSDQISSVHEAGRMSESINRYEEYKLLKEIEAKLNSLQREIRRQKAKKSPNKYISYLPLHEAMLHFWL